MIFTQLLTILLLIDIYCLFYKLYNRIQIRYSYGYDTTYIIILHIYSKYEQWMFRCIHITMSDTISLFAHFCMIFPTLLIRSITKPALRISFDTVKYNQYTLIEHSLY